MTDDIIVRYCPRLTGVTGAPLLAVAGADADDDGNGDAAAELLLAAVLELAAVRGRFCCNVSNCLYNASEASSVASRTSELDAVLFLYVSDCSEVTEDNENTRCHAGTFTLL